MIQSVPYMTLRKPGVSVNLSKLISSFHRALLQSVTFISRLMHSVLQNVNVKIYVV